jgi:alkanesulfonate monooxygenase SsuD/methylene tetrahydromethanopterin reductase-like flavin-dependent oxidoreductase (luciferase family)
MSSTPASWVTHPWVADGLRTVRFGIFNGPLADWPQLRDWVRTVEVLGFDSFWISDHPLLLPIDCWTALAALAIETRRIRLGSLVSCVYYRPPALLARMAADVDRLSSGRLVLGLGIGDYVPEFEQLRLRLSPASERQEALAETIEIVRGLWSTGPFTYPGRHFQVADAAIRPGSLQQPRVPVLIGGGGERVTLGQVAQYADVSNFSPSTVAGNAWSLDDVRRKLAILGERCEQIGRPPESVLRSHLSYLVLAESDSRVKAKLDALAAGPPLEEHARQPGMPRQFTTQYAFPSPKPLRYVLVAGTPPQVTMYYRVLVEAGIRYFIVQCRSDRETVQLLAEKVMPQLGAI